LVILVNMIGIIGIGQMGKPFAKNISKCGYPLIVWNRTIEKAKSVLGPGIDLADSPADLAKKADIIILMLSNNEAVEHVIFSDNGIYPELNSGKIVIDMSTLSPTFSIDVSKRISKKGAFYLDAPVIGSVPQAERAELTILVGGNYEKFNSVLYIFKCLGKNIFYLGPNGSGLSMKMVNNVVMGGNLEILSEALSLGESLGLDRKTMLDIISLGSANSRILELKRENLINNEYEPAFKLQHEEKDLYYALDMARVSKTVMPATAVIHEIYKYGLSKNKGDRDISFIFKILKELSGKD